jgi:membrane protein YdbS with pleckstrin-like domain
MKALIATLVLVLAVVLLVVGWLIALPSVGRIILLGAVVVALIIGLAVGLPDLMRYRRIRSM